MTDDLDAALSHALLESTPNGIVAVDAAQTIRFFNPAAEAMFARSADAVIGQPLDLLIPEDARALHRSHVAELGQGPDTTRRMGERGEIRGLRGDGSAFPAEASIIKLTWGERPLLVAVIADISERKALEEERRRLAEILETTPDFVGIADTEGHVLYHNPAARRLLGCREPARLTDWQVADAHPARFARRLLQEALPTAREKGHWEGESAFLSADGEAIPVSQQIVAHRGADGEIRYFSTIARDLRPYKQAQQELNKLSRALTQTADMVWVTDPEGVVEFVNPAFEQATGVPARDALGRQLSQVLKAGCHDRAFYRELHQRLEEEEDFREIFVNEGPDGQRAYIDETISPVRGEDGEITHFIATGRDVTERFRLEERLRQLAYYDPVTGLANRTNFEEHLERTLPTARRNNWQLAVIFIDLDRFKYVNDTLGHTAGDEVLAQVAGRLTGCLRQGDLVARLGGDEFACLPEPVKGSRGAARVAQKLLAATEAPFEVAGQSFVLHASLGISFFPDSADDSADLIQQADTAMFHAKQAGGNRYHFFSRELSEATARRFHVEKELRQAVEGEAIQAFFQPIVTLPDGRLTGTEALARCDLPSLGRVSPADFIPMAEETGLIHPLGEQVLEQACVHTRAWQEAGHPLEKTAINLSPVQLEAPDFPRRVEAILHRTGLPPGWLELEVTEETLLRGEDKILGQIGELREMGIPIALDDFGTGYSSPAYLKRIPAERLKIDRAFISGVDHDPANQVILESLLVLAEGFGFRVTAEGVETAAEADYLRQAYCHEVQGFLYGAPVPPGELFPAC
ncbi:MAG TPA: EAL domain-containing protein [Gammaproteobacteria bacterium]|nr:EAL domain-containing protein [Gammaproteobacteria bacterium]